MDLAVLDYFIDRMNQIIKNIHLRDKCSLFKKDIINVTFENSVFEKLILSDLHLESVHFINCKFDHVFIEWFFAKNIYISKCKIQSLSLRGNRKITTRKLFSSIRQRRIEELEFEGCKIGELELGGNLQMLNCKFPQGENYLHIKNPYRIYKKSLEYVDNNWVGEKRRIGLMELQQNLSKEVEHQNEDFIVYSHNEYLSNEINEIIRSVYQLIKEVASAGHR